MSDQREKVADRRERLEPEGYEPPRVDRVVGTAELGQEVLYAGIIVTQVET